jgi:tetratricopeptide (TPR) repeat protein
VDAAVVFLAALAVRLIALLEIRRGVFTTVLVGDARQYDAWARTIAGGDWLGGGVFYQAPLYPYFLGTLYAVLGPHLLPVRIVQILVGSLACVFLLLAGRRFFDARTGLIAGLLLALYAPAVFFDVLIQKTVLDAALMVLLVALLARTLDRPRGPLFFAAGLVLAALSLTRENGLILLPWIVAWILIHFRHEGRLRRIWTLAFVVGAFALLLPVAVRNKAVGGEFALTTAQLGPNLYMGNNPYTDGRCLPLREGRADARYERQDAVELAEEEEGRKLSPAGVSAFWAGRVLGYIGSHPGDWARLMGRKALLFWNAGEVVDTEGLEAYREQSRLLRALSPVFHFGSIAPLAVLGFVLTLRARRRLWILYGIVFAMSASVILFFILARYRHPMAPVLMLFAAAGIRHLALPEGAERRASRTTAAAVVLALATMVLVNRPFPFAGPQRAISYYSVGDALVEAGLYGEAIPCLEEALRSKPDFRAARRRLSVALEEAGRRTEAIAVLERGIPADPPGAGDFLSRLGRLRFENGDYQGALEAYRRVITLQPDRAGPHSDLGAALVNLGRPAEAVASLEIAVALEPELGLAHLNLGLALFRLGSTEAASVHLDRAAALEPGNAGVYLVRGMVREALGMKEGAAGDYRRVLQILPEQEEARSRLAGLR